ncbi:MAG: hypothetical protein AB8B74_14385 [Crocinitomicaceae bacterium]
MKILNTLLMVCLSMQLSAQITVVEKNVKVNLTENGLFLSVPYGDKKMFDKALKDELKDWKGKITNKEFYFADDCKLKEIGENTFDAYAKVEDITKGGVIISVQLDLGGAYLNSKVHPAEYKVFEKRLYDFAVSTSKDIIEDEAKAQEKVMQKQEDELEDIKGELEKQGDLIIAANKAIAAAKDAIKKQEENKLKKEAEIKETTTKIEGIRAKKEAVK